MHACMQTNIQISSLDKQYYRNTVFQINFSSLLVIRLHLIDNL